MICSFSMQMSLCTHGDMGPNRDSQLLYVNLEERRNFHASDFNGSLRRVTRRTGPDVWEFQFRDRSIPKLPMRQITLSTLEYRNSSPSRVAGSIADNQWQRDLCCAAVSNLRSVLDKFIADERLKEIKAFRPSEVVDEGLKFSTTTGYLSVIKQHLRPAWGKIQLTDIKPSKCRSG